MNRLQAKTWIATAVLAGSGALAAVPAFAQVGAGGTGSPAYGGLSLSASKWRDSVGGVSEGSAGTGFKVYGGWQFTPNFALEGGAVGLGRVSNASGEAKARGYFLDAVGVLPLDNNWSLLGRAGVVNVKTITSTADSDRGWGTKIGLGAQYQLTKSLALRGEWERYRLNAFDTHPNVDQLSVGLKLGF
jgi:OOP family OmpA-OmpF porin